MNKLYYNGNINTLTDKKCEAILVENNMIIELGKDEKIDVLDCLKAVTTNVAYQYSEDSYQGTIEVGKQANFVILDKNPLVVDKKTIKDIKVLEVIKCGNKIN